MITKQQRNISGFIRKVHYAYFGVKLGDEDKSWAAQKVCFVCAEDLRKWSIGKKKTFRFCVTMIWREPKNHSDDCYFCCCNIKCYNSKNKKVILPRTFLQLYALLFMAQRYPHLNQQKD
jgi:hypothetical protein